MKILDLFIAAFIPVLKVLLLTALGLFLALDRIDILGDLARQHLNKVILTAKKFQMMLYFFLKKILTKACQAVKGFGSFNVVQVVFFVFNPALVGSSLADHITAEGIGMLWVCILYETCAVSSIFLLFFWSSYHLFSFSSVNSLKVAFKNKIKLCRWFMPLNILITYIVGSALGWIVLKTTKAPYDLWGLVLGCCAAGSFPSLALLLSIWVKWR